MCFIPISMPELRNFNISFLCTDNDSARAKGTVGISVPQSERQKPSTIRRYRPHMQAQGPKMG